MSTRAMGSHQSTRAQSTTWLTPLDMIRDLGPFGLDPCGHPGWPTADSIITLPTDGRVIDWHGRVWLNPPYGNEAWQWLNRLADHGSGTALIFARTETRGFIETVWRRATALRFLHGRLHFHRPDGTRAAANSGAPSVLVAYGRYDAHRLQQSTLPGSYVQIGDQE